MLASGDRGCGVEVRCDPQSGCARANLRQTLDANQVKLGRSYALYRTHYSTASCLGAEAVRDNGRP